MRFLRTLYAVIRGRFRSGGFKPGGHIPGGPLPARLHDGEWLIWIDDDGHWVGRQYRTRCGCETVTHRIGRRTLRDVDSTRCPIHGEGE